MNRENLYQALFTLLTNDATLGPQLQTKSRLLKHWSDVSPSACPALFQIQGNEDPVYGGINMPPKWILHPELYVYVDTSGDSSRVPSSVMNPIIDAVVGALDAAKSPITNTITLSGQAVQCRIGKIETDEGTLGTKGVAIIPIEITTV